MNLLKKTLFLFGLFGANLSFDTTVSNKSVTCSSAVKQEQICGQYCLASILQYFKKDVQLSELLSVAPAGHGSDLFQLKTIAEAYDLKTLGVKVSGDILLAMKKPAILHVNGDHFIALLPDKAKPNFTVIDPPHNFHIISFKDLYRRWKWEGSCLIIDEHEIIPPKTNLIQKNIAWLYGLVSVLIFRVFYAGKGFISMKKKQNVIHISTLLPIVIPIFFCVSLCYPKDLKRTNVAGIPKIFVENPVFDAGIVFDNIETIEHTFKIKNSGTGNLIISKIITDCSCTTVNEESVKEKVVRPGEYIPLVVKFDLKNQFGKLAERKTAVITSDPETPQMVLIIKAERKREFAMDPPVALLGTIPARTGKTFLMQIRSATKNRKIYIDKAHTSSPFIEVTEVNSNSKSQDFNEYLLKIYLRPATPPGLINEVVQIPCTGAFCKVIKIPVSGEVEGPIKPSLSKIQFGLVRHNDKEKRKDILLSSDDEFSVLDINVDQSWLKVTQEKLDKQKSELKITIVPQNIRGKGNLDGLVTVITDLSDMEKFVIPVYAYACD